MGKMSDEKFIQIYEENKTSIFRIAFSYLRVKEDAQDVLQDTFLKLYMNPPKDDSNLFGWLARVTRNNCLDIIKKKKKEKEYFLKCQEEFHSDKKKFDILKYVLKLDEKYSFVIRLYYYGDLSIKDISIALKISESNVKKRLERAREKLKIMIEEEK